MSRSDLRRGGRFSLRSEAWRGGRFGANIGTMRDLPMATLTHLQWARFERTRAKLERIRAALDQEIRRAQFLQALSKRRRKHRQATEARPAPRLTVITAK
jgi:hypothetical protein